LKKVTPTRKTTIFKMSSDMRSVSAPKIDSGGGLWSGDYKK